MKSEEQTYFIQLEVDKKWLDVIANLTNDENEVCKWISIQAVDNEEN